MNDKYNDRVCKIRHKCGFYEMDSYLMLKKLLKKTANDKTFISDFSENLDLLIELVDIICYSYVSGGLDEKVIKRLSELSLLVGIVRNISTLSKDYRKRISESVVFSNFETLFYNKIDGENIGILNILGFEIAKLESESQLTLNLRLCEFGRELILFPSRLLQLFANLAVDSCFEYQNVLFERLYPFGLLNYCLFELIMLNKLESMNIDIEINTSVVGSVFHLLFILFKNRPDLLDLVLSKREFLCSFVYISLSMYVHSSKLIGNKECLNSEWIFFLFTIIFSKYPSSFGDFYSFECSENKTIECDTSLVYLTILEPFVRIMMIHSNLKNVSDAMLTQEIIVIQNYISRTIIPSLEYKDLLLNILIELDTNTNLKDETNKENILLNILEIEETRKVLSSEIDGLSLFIDKYLIDKLELVRANSTIFISEDSGIDIDATILWNVRTWISLFKIELDNYEFDHEFFNKIYKTLSSILESMLKFRKECISYKGINNIIDGSIWTEASRAISIPSILQAILAISLNNEHILNIIEEDNSVIEAIIECTTIVDENHPLIKESSMLLLRGLAEKSCKLAKKILDCSVKPACS